ncbi:hypothetical protein LguiB_027357 [Lonicera macranthoides]
MGIQMRLNASANLHLLLTATQKGSHRHSKVIGGIKAEFKVSNDGVVGIAAYRKLGAIGAWENSKRASVEAQLKQIKAHSYSWKVYDDQGAVKSMLDATKPVSFSVLKLWQRFLR